MLMLQQQQRTGEVAEQLVVSHDACICTGYATAGMTCVGTC